MAKKKIDVVLILDETGSMTSVKDDTIGGYNDYLSSLQKEKAVKYLFTLMKFDSNHQTIVHDAEAIADVPKLTAETYNPGAFTPLYDAVGKGINKLGRKKNVLFVIQTDGLENASREFSLQQIQDLITEKTAFGWQFAFLGAGQDAWVAGGAMGIPKGSTLSYDQGNTKGAFGAVGAASVNYAAAGAVSTKTFFEDTDIREPTTP